MHVERMGLVTRSNIGPEVHGTEGVCTFCAFTRHHLALPLLAVSVFFSRRGNPAILVGSGFCMVLFESLILLRMELLRKTRFRICAARISGLL